MSYGCSSAQPWRSQYWLSARMICWNVSMTDVQTANFTGFHMPEHSPHSIRARLQPCVKRGREEHHHARREDRTVAPAHVRRGARVALNSRAHARGGKLRCNFHDVAAFVDNTRHTGV